MAEDPGSTIPLGPRIAAVPSIHGRTAFAQQVRRAFLAERFGCVAVELPESLACAVTEAVERLPVVSAVVYEEPPPSEQHVWVPVEPGDSIVEAVRMALAERVEIAWIDPDVPVYEPAPVALPDEYAVTRVGLAAYYRAVRAALPVAPPESQQERRERWMAARLAELARRHERVLLVCGLAHLEGIRRHLAHPEPVEPAEPVWLEPRIYDVHPDTLYFLTGELPYLVALYERCRASLDLAEFEKTDGLKDLLLEARADYAKDFPEELESLTPGALQLLLRFLRNLCLVQGRFTPDLYDLVVSAKGVGGGAFAARVVEMAKFYPWMDPESQRPVLRLRPEGLVLPGLGPVEAKSRLPGRPLVWKNVRLERRPKPKKQRRWRWQWNPFGQCSWPAEDDQIERFTAHVRRRAKGLLGEDQARVEKFTTSLKDGLDLRETIRNWHTGEIYVKEVPPVRGDVGAVVFIFEPDRGTDRYPWHATWQAEHDNESTLAFYATDFSADMVGPGIGRAVYGGAMFVFPPRVIPDIWEDPRFASAADPVERLVQAAVHYSRARHVAYVAAARPGARLRRAARPAGRHLVYLPLSGFAATTLRKMRRFHVLGGQHIRSYAREFIR